MPLARRCVLPVLALAACVHTTAAWWCNGHMLVASISQAYMLPSTFSAVQNLTQQFSAFFPLSPDFVSSACWLDDIRGQGNTVYDQWHFINMPVIKGPVEFALTAVYPNYNVVWAVNSSFNVLASPSSTSFEKAQFLRFLTHFVGDLHQPLHIMTMYSDFFPPPLGDQGGNQYLIQTDLLPNVTNLQSFYDSGAAQYVPELPRPLTPAGRTWLNGWVTALVTEFPRTSFGPQLNDTDPQSWMLEEFKDTFDQVYSTPYDAPMSLTYINDTKTLLRRQIALAGYRLAQLLDSSLGGAGRGLTSPLQHPSPALRGALHTHV